MSEDYDYSGKVVLIGDASCGKSSILSRFLGRPYMQSYRATIGVDFGHRIVEVKGNKVKLQLWDTAGQERFRSVTQSYYRGANAMIYVFDLTNLQSFESVKKWRAEGAIANFGILLGNKCDLPDKVVDFETANHYAQEVGIPYLAVSAKDNINIEQAFKLLSESIYDLQEKSHVEKLVVEEPVHTKKCAC